MVLDSVTSTPQWIRQPKPRDDVHDVCVFVCKCVIGSSRASQPLDILAYAFSSTSAFSLRLMSLRLAVLAVGATPAFLGSSAPAPRLPSLTAHARAHPDYTLLDPRVCPTCFFISILRSLMCLSTFPCTLTSCSSSRVHALWAAMTTSFCQRHPTLWMWPIVSFCTSPFQLRPHSSCAF